MSKTSFAIGCLVQWYESDIIEEYLTSLSKAIKLYDGYVLVDINIAAGQDLEKAESYFFRYTPILIGTAIGTATMGPVGLALNLKLPSLFIFGGGLLGGMAGYKIQKI